MTSFPEISTYALQSMFANMQLTDVKEAFKAFPENVKESYYGKQVNESIELAVASSLIKQGAAFPSLSVYNMDGKAERILDIVKQNRLTLIDCWASWCKPCRAEVPTLKKMYAKYKDKGFGIVGISSDKDIDAWKKAVSQDGTEWLHFIQDKTHRFSETFGIKGIPTYILVDGEGKLIAFDAVSTLVSSFGGDLKGESLEKKLKETLGQ